PFKLVVTGPGGYEHSDNDAEQSTHLENLASGTYTIKVTDKNGCTDTVTKKIENDPGDLDVKVDAENGVCGDKGKLTIKINGGKSPFKLVVNGPGSYDFSDDNAGQTTHLENLASGTYTIKVTDKNGCQTTIYEDIENTSGDLGLNLTPSNGICESKGKLKIHITGGKKSFMIRVTGPNGYLSESTQNGRSYDLSDLADGSYTVTVKDGNGCEITREVLIQNDPGNIEVWATPVPGTCGEGGKIEISINGGTPGFTIQLTGAGATQTQTQEDRSYTFSSLVSGDYLVKVTDSNGCSHSREVKLKNEDGDLLSKFVCDVTALTAKFTNESSDGDYYWDFGDGETSTLKNPTHEYCEEGQYTICLTVTNECGTKKFCKGIEVSIPDDICVLDIGDAKGAAGSNVYVPVTLRNCKLIVSLAGTLEVTDPSVAKILGISGEKITPHFNDENNTFNYFDNSGQGIYLNDDDILFYIVLQLKGDKGDMTFVKFSNDPLMVEIGSLENGMAVTKPHVTLKGKITIKDTGNVEGRVSTWWDEGIMNTEVTIQGEDFNAMTMTDDDGYYSLDEVPAGTEYEIIPARALAANNGLSTYALFAGQRFILGYAPAEIQSPYQVIAGDANCNGSFTTLDLFIIQQIIIGIREDFNDCPSWVFVKSNSSMPDNFDAYNVFPYENRDRMMIDGAIVSDFVGVKVGDILGHANPHNLQEDGEVEIRNDQALALRVQNQSLQKGETVELNFYSNDFNEIVSYQLALGFDPAVLRYDAFIEPATTQLNSVVAGATDADQGLLRISWFDLNGQGFTANPDAAIFTIRLTANEDIEQLSDHLFVSDRSITAVAHNTSATAYDIVLEFETETTTSVGTIEANGYVLHQNNPNPFREQTDIRFELPNNMEAELLIHNQFGQLIKRYEGGFVKGLNKIRIEQLDLASGVYYYTLKAQDFSGTRSMIVIE
ncbi:MAG: T9SS type A sorting domain-containing protein, partial [Bacteroidota bacterium]